MLGRRKLIGAKNFTGAGMADACCESCESGSFCRTFAFMAFNSFVHFVGCEIEGPSTMDNPRSGLRMIAFSFQKRTTNNGSRYWPIMAH